MPGSTFLSRQERFAVVGSTNDVVGDWLAGGVPEVCLAVADEQSAGRGREGRTWIAPRGTALLASLGFRPTYLEPQSAWRLAAAVSLAMADAAEDVAGLPDGAIRLKWPNDLVIERPAGERGRLLKLAGLLGESDGLGGPDPQVVVGIGVNADWHAADFPAELGSTMTSLREAAGDRPVDLAPLLSAFLMRLEVAIAALRGGRFEIAGWTRRQVTTGRLIRLETSERGLEIVRVVGVDETSGGLLVSDPMREGPERLIVSGEVRHVRLVDDESSGADASTAESPSGSAPVGV